LLEVGCAAGYFLDEARSAGWAVSGVEPNGQMAELARSLLGLDVQTAQLGNASALDAAEVVVLLNVLEHLPAPRAVERQLSEVVRPGGILFLETWDAASMSARLLRGRWHQWSPLVPYYHCRRSLDALFPASRWQPACWRKSAKWIPLWRGLEIVGIRAGATLRHRWPWRWHVPYQTGDLVQAAYRRLGS
jgi:SAM-dependent methyltransferase